MENKGNNNIETYEKDMLKALESGGDGIVKKIIHQEEEKENLKEINKITAYKNKFFVLAGSLLILISFFGIIFFFLNKITNVVDVPNKISSIIFLDKSSFLEISELNKERIINIISNKIKTTQVKDGGIEGIYLTENKNLINLKRFLNLIDVNFSNTSDFILSNDFLLGVVKKDNKNIDFFILMKVSSFQDVFPIMREWENKMFFDLHGFFNVEMTEENKYLLNTNFKDEIIQNKNTRVLYDKNNQVVLMYVYIDETSVIITNTENAVKETMFRINSSKIGK